MRRTARAWAVGCAAGTLGLAPARAQSLDVEGYLDLRVADAGDETSWLDGGLGKARFGAGDDAWSGGGALTAHFQATPALLATATVQYQPELGDRLKLKSLGDSVVINVGLDRQESASSPRASAWPLQF